MAPAGTPPSALPPVYGWTDGAPYVVARQGAQRSFNYYIQAFACFLLVTFGLCHVTVQRRAAAHEVAQQQRRVALVEMAELRRTGRLAAREREMAEEAASAEAWEASWLYPFWHMGEEATGIPKLVQVIQPGDAQFELGVVLLEKGAVAGVPVVRNPDTARVAGDNDDDDGKQQAQQPGDSDGQLGSATPLNSAGASTIGTADVATAEDFLDNPLHEAGHVEDSLHTV
jgi:hypothetical protein|eukprot:COSAG02_NODE_12636_length_1516_cov_1.417078_2_plen_228_part_00